MKLYFTLRSLPEMEGIPKEDQKYILKRHLWKSYRHWQCWVFSVLYVACFVGGYQLMTRLEQPFSLKVLIGFPLFLLAIAFLHIGRLNWSRPYIRNEVDFLNSKGLTE